MLAETYESSLSGVPSPAQYCRERKGVRRGGYILAKIIKIAVTLKPYINIMIFLLLRERRLNLDTTAALNRLNQ